MLNIELLFDWNYLNNKWHFKHKNKTASRWRQVTDFITESLIRLNGWFIQERSKWPSLWMGNWIIDSLDSFKNAGSFINETMLCLNGDVQRLSYDFETIFLDEIEQNQAILLKSFNVHHFILTYCLLNCCINLISHLQTLL